MPPCGTNMRALVHLALLPVLAACSTTDRNMFPEWQQLGSFQRHWYSRLLIAAGEKPIITPVQTPVYRFIWLRSFDHPVVIRIECPEKCHLSAKMLSGSGGYDPGRVSRRRERTLSKEEKGRFMELLSRVNDYPGDKMNRVNGPDGAQWVFEEAGDADYEAIDVWSPELQIGPGAAAYAAFCRYMIKLSGFEVQNNKIY